MTYKTSSNGKILMTSEYIVLKGALALAIPTKFKQSLIFEQNNSSLLVWESYNSENKIWFQCEILLPNLELINSSDKRIGKILHSILHSAKKINPNFLTKNNGGTLKTKLDFPNNWGLGSSSTLINNIAKWSKTNPFKLLWANYKGSGYDIACADSISPILYKLENNIPVVRKTTFNPAFSKNLFFIHLNKKQNTNKEIKTFNSKNIPAKFINNFSDLTKKIISANNLDDFQSCIKKHESLLSEKLLIDPIKKKLFEDYEGEIKSLGAWGGDFILAAGPFDTPNYFKKKGFKTIITYKEMF